MCVLYVPGEWWGNRNVAARNDFFMSLCPVLLYFDYSRTLVITRQLPRAHVNITARVVRVLQTVSYKKNNVFDTSYNETKYK